MIPGIYAEQADDAHQTKEVKVFRFLQFLFHIDTHKIHLTIFGGSFRVTLVVD